MPEIRIQSDLPAYLAVPEGEGPWPAVVILFESFGDTADMRAQADRFAARGYLAVLPDLYGGRHWLRCVRKAVRDLLARRGPTFAHIEAARSWAAGRDDCTGRVGVVGFCMGGGFALVAAAKLDFQAAAVNYGVVPRHAERVLAGACPVVASYGGEDRTLPGAAAKLERALTVLEVRHDVKEYPGAGHSFLTESDGLVPAPLLAVGKVTFGLGKGKEQAPEAWERILGFLDGELENGSTT
ncbi:dienelactone hydrolase family protein [Actinomadura harenae]|uniref:Dienelactone hydrolase family protein n=1 Tax=Actinomadura harenae TaxID=2483351 RepID=A0A3M2LM72_9ACTN|nr:dienelactone hydrolase family protein [Actinomadura harenae]RMI37633.1 dienelactone hydrolase family protein [Actinomadura harenae]